MPQIKISGVETEKICAISTHLIDELENLLQCPREYFTIECPSATYIQDGKIVKGNPFIEVCWFDRGQAVQDQAAKIITVAVQKIGYPNLDVLFTVLPKEKYYENGEHF